MKRLLGVLVVLVAAAGLAVAAPAKFVWYIPAPHPYFDTVKVGVEAFAKEYDIDVKEQVGPDWNMDSENMFLVPAHHRDRGSRSIANLV